jgi:bifunctional DNA-binding transcriptional regulator/antitoxin component of YhaV-PrlF toxin-antitoxin module
MARNVDKSRRAPSGFSEEKEAGFGADRQFVELGTGGRLVIPAAFRTALGMKPGDRLTMRLEGNELRVYTQREGIRRAQELVRKYIPEGVSLVDELIAERRAEAAKELKDIEDE